MELEKSVVKVGFVNGCFDILHIGHKRLLEYARSKCDYLIVGIDADNRVKRLKGENRPFNSEDVRSEMLMSLTAVSEVKIFDTEESLKTLIKYTKPDIMVVGSDYRNKEVVGA